MKKKKWIYISLFVGIFLVGILFWSYNIILEPYKGDTKWIMIDAKEGNNALYDSLEMKLGNEYSDKVYNLWSILGGDINQSVGAYKVENGMTIWDITKSILRNHQTPIKVVFNNVRTFEQFSSRVSSCLNFTEQELLQACDSILPIYGFNKANYVSAFLPDSYEFYWTVSAETFVKKMLKYYDSFWDENREKKADALGLSPMQISIIASIVEEETNKRDERPFVARLYMNRLKKNMKLQADPTIKFAIGDFTLRRITHSHLQIESPYNTYKYEGLPPGPIRMADKRTLDAVLNAPNHKYIYMCAKEDFSGYHNFAVDYDSHKENARRYQAELNRRKIK